MVGLDDSWPFEFMVPYFGGTNSFIFWGGGVCISFVVQARWEMNDSNPKSKFSKILMAGLHLCRCRGSQQCKKIVVFKDLPYGSA